MADPFIVRNWHAGVREQAFRLPVILSQDEVVRLIESARLPFHRTISLTVTRRWRPDRIRGQPTTTGTRASTATGKSQYQATDSCTKVDWSM